MRTISAIIVSAMMVFSAGANAHTTGIGYHNSGPGSVTFWFKSWHAFTPPFFEGSFNLVGINGNPFPSTTVPFSLSVGVKPPQLIDGVNNFYACSRLPNGLCPTDEDQNDGSKWQGVQFTNLQAGDYRFTYIPIANPSQDWASATPGVNSNTLTLSGAVVGGPPPATDIPTLSEWTLILLGGLVALFGIGKLSRRRTVG